jgi:precorrin-2/cobalt-factor-2 C20-methyltransferase
MPKTGKLFGVGVGPGDPELLTLKAHKILTRVPVIFVPRKSEESDSFSQSIIHSYVNFSGKKVISLVFPMIRAGKELNSSWVNAANSIWNHLSDGEDCAFINLGDPLLYGTFIYVLKELQEKHPELEVEIIPGVTSVTAAAAASTFPLASNNERVAIISAERDDDFIRETLTNFETVVFLKVSAIFDRLIKILEELNIVDHAVYIRRCSTPEEEIVRDIRKFKGTRPDYFSILLVRRNKW